MTNRYSPPNRSMIDQEIIVPWVNASGKEIPAFGVVQLRRPFATTSKADKPNGTSGLFFVNGPVLVGSDADATGESFLWDKPRRVLLSSDAVVGDEVGPTSGSWEMSSGGTGWRVLRQAIEGVGVVVMTGGGGSDISDGIVSIKHGCGWYTIEKGAVAVEGGSGSESASGSVDDCDPCNGVSSASTSGCELVLAGPPSKVIGNGVFVLAYDPQSVTIPLEGGTDCVIGRVSGGGAGSTSGSGTEESSGSSAAGVTPWRVLRGYQEHIVQYRERWECCSDGTPRLIGKTPVILVGVECDEIICGECPASESV